MSTDYELLLNPGIIHVKLHTGEAATYKLSKPTPRRGRNRPMLWIVDLDTDTLVGSIRAATEREKDANYFEQMSLYRECVYRLSTTAPAHPAYVWKRMWRTKTASRGSVEIRRVELSAGGAS